MNNPKKSPEEIDSEAIKLIPLYNIEENDVQAEEKTMCNRERMWCRIVLERALQAERSEIERLNQELIKEKAYVKGLCQNVQMKGNEIERLIEELNKTKSYHVRSVKSESEAWGMFKDAEREIERLEKALKAIVKCPEIADGYDMASACECEMLEIAKQALGLKP